MIGPIRQTPRHAFAFAIVMVTIAGLTLMALTALNLNAPPPQSWPAFAPRGPVIGAVWVVLFGAMGLALWSAHSKRGVLGLIGLCLAYPFYTHAFASHLAELLGTLITLAYAAALIGKLRRESPLATAAIGLVAAWLVFATALAFELLRLNGNAIAG